MPSCFRLSVEEAVASCRAAAQDVRVEERIIEVPQIQHVEKAHHRLCRPARRCPERSTNSRIFILDDLDGQSASAVSSRKKKSMSMYVLSPKTVYDSESRGRAVVLKDG